MKELTLVILAAGLSTRFGRSKPLEPLGPAGETLPQYTAHDALGAGFRHVVLVVSPTAETALREYLTPRMPAGIAVSFVTQETAPALQERSRPWGTGAAVLAAAGAVRGPFVVANADDLYGRQALEAAADHLRDPMRAGTHALVGFRLRETLSDAGGVSRAICEVAPGNVLVGVEEVLNIRRGEGGLQGDVAVSGASRSLRGDELVSMNLWALHPEVTPELARHFAHFRAAQAGSADAEFQIGPAVDALIAEGTARFQVLPCEARWHGITHPADRAPLVRAIAGLVSKGRYPSPLPGHR